MRVYVPATVTMLRALNSAGELVAVGGTAFALTPALRESYATGGDEELEYAAMLDAARASLRLINAEAMENTENTENADNAENTDSAEAADGQPFARRAVVSADVDGAVLRPDLDHAVVRLAGPIPLKVIAAVHLDTAEAEEAVRAAAAVVDAADLGDPDAEFAIGSAEDHELAWYAVQELPFVLDLL